MLRATYCYLRTWCKVENYEIKEVAGEYVVIPIGNQMAKHKGFFSCDRCGMEFFNCIKQGMNKAETVKYFLENSDAKKENVEKDYDEFVEKIQKIGIEF